ncbi:MAG: hypothetical protein QNJ04_12825 [Desulfobacterales bacterium]|nr:hypothetical protein [Desulfobacterales bacterium]
MAWQVEYIAEQGIVRVIYAGRVTAEDFRKATRETLDLATGHKTLLILIDTSKLEQAVSTPDIYEMPIYYEEMKGNRRTRTAILLPASNPALQDAEFYVTVCRNRGWLVEPFVDEQEATQWLCGTRAPPVRGDAPP